MPTVKWNVHKSNQLVQRGPTTGAFDQRAILRKRDNLRATSKNDI